MIPQWKMTPLLQKVLADPELISCISEDVMAMDLKPCYIEFFWIQPYTLGYFVSDTDTYPGGRRHILQRASNIIKTLCDKVNRKSVFWFMIIIRHLMIIGDHTDRLAFFIPGFC
jgi:hypothetical protein